MRIKAERLAEQLADELKAEFASDFDDPPEIDYRDALLIELSRSHAWVSWLNKLVVRLPSDHLKQLDMAGKFERPSVWYELLSKERAHLLNVVRSAGALGLDERRVRLAEQQGEMLVAVIRNVLDGLGLSAEQQALAPELVGRHLRAAALEVASSEVAPPAGG